MVNLGIRWWAAVRGVLAVSVLIGSTASGCSLIFVDGPPPDHATRPYFDCTSGRLAPIADATVAGLVALSTLGAASDTPSGSDRVEGALLGTAIALGMLGSSVRGWTQTAACREAKVELAARLTDRASPQYAVPFVPRADPWLAAGPPPEVTRGAPASPSPPSAPPVLAPAASSPPTRRP